MLRDEIRNKAVDYLKKHALTSNFAESELRYFVGIAQDRVVSDKIVGADHAYTIQVKKSFFRGDSSLDMGPPGVLSNVHSLAKHGKENMGFGGNRTLSKGTVLIGLYDHPEDPGYRHWKDFSKSHDIAVLIYNPGKNYKSHNWEAWSGYFSGTRI